MLAALLLQLVLRASPLRAAEPGAELTISLLTMGPGEHPFTKFGHSALWVHDAAAERDEVFNYGTFAFNSATLLLDSVAGKLPYWLSVQSLRGTLLTYGEQRRSLLVSELGLLPRERAALYAALRVNARPENRYYRYDYYRDNCSTRIRDVVDHALHGTIRAQALAPASMSYRAHTLRLVADDTKLYVALDWALGRNTDVPISTWDEAFLPERLHALFASTRVRRDGQDQPLIVAERALLAGESAAPRGTPPDYRLRYGLVGLLLGMTFAALGLGARSRRSGRTALACAYLLLGLPAAGLAGSLGYLTFVSRHSAAAANYNVLLLPLWLLALPVAAIGLLRGDPPALRVIYWLTLASLLTSLLGLLIHGATSHPQANAQELAFALPLWLGAAAAAFLAAAPRPRASGQRGP